MSNLQDNTQTPNSAMHLLKTHLQHFIHVVLVAQNNEIHFFYYPAILPCIYRLFY